MLYYTVTPWVKVRTSSSRIPQDSNLRIFWYFSKDFHMSYSSFKDLQLISRIDNNMFIDFMALHAEFELTALSLVIYLRARISLFIVMLMTHSFTSKHSLICSLPYLHYDVLLIYKTGCHPSNYSRMRIKKWSHAHGYSQIIILKKVGRQLHYHHFLLTLRQKNNFSLSFHSHITYIISESYKSLSQACLLNLEKNHKSIYFAQTAEFTYHSIQTLIYKILFFSYYSSLYKNMSAPLHLLEYLMSKTNSLQAWKV